jgi:hypothetical protein
MFTYLPAAQFADEPESGLSVVAKRKLNDVINYQYFILPTFNSSYFFLVKN